MPLTPEQVKELKAQLSNQIKNMPEAQRKAAQAQIDEMSPEAIESMLEQQKAQGPKDKKPIFRAIIAGEIPSKKIDENKEVIAVLDIRPISKGHVIILSKKHITNSKEMPTSAFTLAKKIAKKISSKLKSSGAEIVTESKFGEIILNIVPIYDKPLDLSSPRTEMTEEEINEVFKKLVKIIKPKVIKLNQPKKQSNLVQLKRRIP